MWKLEYDWELGVFSIVSAYNCIDCIPAIGLNLIKIWSYFLQKRKKSKKTKQKDSKKNNNEPRVKISSLTCLFVYKVLNQEVLDDRGKFEVSLTLKKWVLKSWRQDIRRHVYLAHIIKNPKVFSVACDKEYDLQFISGWEVSSLEENFKRSVMQVRRQSIVRPPETDESFGWGWNRADVFPKIFKKHRNLL